MLGRAGEQHERETKMADLDTIMRENPAIKAQIEKAEQVVKNRRSDNFGELLLYEGEKGIQFDDATAEMLKEFSGTKDELGLLMGTLVSVGGCLKTDGRSPSKPAKRTIEQLLTALDRPTDWAGTPAQRLQRDAPIRRELSEHPGLGAAVATAEQKGDWATALRLKNLQMDMHHRRVGPTVQPTTAAASPDIAERIREAESKADYAAIVGPLTTELLHGKPRPTPTPKPKPARSELETAICDAEAKGDWATVLKLSNRITDTLAEEFNRSHNAPAG